MKRVAAIGGDLVSSHAEGVSVNGHLLPFSQPQAVELNIWQIDSYHLKSNEVLLMTDQNQWSFDARYFGLIDKVQIKEVIKTLLIIPNDKLLRPVCENLFSSSFLDGNY